MPIANCLLITILNCFLVVIILLYLSYLIIKLDLDRYKVLTVS